MCTAVRMEGRIRLVFSFWRQVLGSGYILNWGGGGGCICLRVESEWSGYSWRDIYSGVRKHFLECLNIKDSCGFTLSWWCFRYVED